ncbi:MAG: NUDIX hydrolase [Chloroflexales bacterium]|nr:NUDIX hydrolase [Chloroflexales bacterium]
MHEHSYYAQLPKKRMAAGALLLDPRNQVLIVQTVYRVKWLILGGIIEADESPRAGCTREIKEELGYLTIGRLLCIEYRSAEPQKSENMHYIFFGGYLQQQHIAQIVLPLNELRSYQFRPLAEAVPLPDARLGRRLTLAWQALHEQRTIYTEDGREA